MSTSVQASLARLEHEIRERYDSLGYEDYEEGAFKTGRAPKGYRLTHLVWRYAGLDSDGLVAAEAEAGGYIPEAYKELLAHMNGASILGVSFHGAADALVDRSVIDIGSPISLRYQNIIERPDYVPKGHLGFGTINGAWFSQGHLYLSSTGEVELYHASFDLIGARWPSLAVFLDEEIRRRFTLFDNNGSELDPSHRLPGNTADWEDRAAEAKGAEKRRRLPRLFHLFR